MSSTTKNWTADKPDRWAETLGLVGVPLFGPSRAGAEGGVHTLLLDGDRGSFILSVCDVDGPNEISPLLSWCWSSNVTFGAVVRPRTRFVTLHRWDARDSLRRFTIEDELSARTLFDKLASTSRPKAPSAVQRLISVFRSLRRVCCQASSQTASSGCLTHSCWAQMPCGEGQLRKMNGSAALRSMNCLPSLRQSKSFQETKTLWKRSLLTHSWCRSLQMSS